MSKFDVFARVFFAVCLVIFVGFILILTNRSAHRTYTPSPEIYSPSPVPTSTPGLAYLEGTPVKQDYWYCFNTGYPYPHHYRLEKDSSKVHLCFKEELNNPGP